MECIEHEQLMQSQEGLVHFVLNPERISETMSKLLDCTNDWYKKHFDRAMTT